MTTFYCPNRWREVSESATVCSHCHTNISERISQTDYIDKLIAALRHKEPMTPVRAAWILGERREPKAVPALTKIVRKGRTRSLSRARWKRLEKLVGARRQMRYVLRRSIQVCASVSKREMF